MRESHDRQPQRLAAALGARAGQFVRSHPRRDSPLLPPGHPFSTGATGVQSAIYWSATTIKAIPSNAWGVNFSNGEVTDISDVTVNGHLHWCVRGGQNHGDEY